MIDELKKIAGVENNHIFWAVSPLGALAICLHCPEPFAQHSSWSGQSLNLLLEMRAGAPKV